MTDIRIRRALVTGASRGIGRTIAEHLARDGFEVLVHYGRDAQAAADVVAGIAAAGGSARAIQAEFGGGGDVASLAEKVLDYLGEGTLDVLVNNVGIELMGHLEEISQEDFERTFDVNVRAQFFLTQALLPRLTEGGRIITITSDLSRIAYPEGIAYAMSKGALNVMTRALAKDLGDRGICVNAVAPGLTRTDLAADYIASASEQEIVAETRVALGRIGSTQEVADVVAFLASDGGRWITGQCIEVNGGASL